MATDPGARRAPRPWGLWLLGAAIIIVAVGGYLSATALKARQQLLAARADVSALKSHVLAGDNAAAQRDLSLARSASSSAHGLTGGPVWAVAAAIPWAGGPFNTLRTVASTAHDVTGGLLPDIIATAGVLSPDKLRVAGDKLDLAALSSAAPRLDRASAEANAADRRLRRDTGTTWLGAADRGRAQFLTLLDGLQGTLTNAAAASRLMPPMLGADGPRNYLLAFENDAEARGLGGLTGAYAILHTDHGRMTFTRFGNDGDLAKPVNVDLGTGFTNRYLPLGAEDLFLNSDVSPHFPYAAQIWRAMWKQKTRQTLDGALATDPTALSYLLGATGPTKLSDGTVVTADNVVALTESQAYVRYPTVKDAAARKTYLLAISRAVADHVVHDSSGHTRALATAMGHAIGERRLLVWSAHPDEEKQLSAFPLAGLLPQTSSPFTALVINNAAGDKLDY